MARTPSKMLDLGTQAPAFSLPDTEGKIVSLDSLATDKGLLVVFMCNHCPYVLHIDKALAAATKEFMEKGIAVVGINANDIVQYPEDSPEKMRLEKARAGYSFPYLFDATQNVAKSYQAACTPDFFLFDGSLSLYYRGQFDSSRPGSKDPVTGIDLRNAVSALLKRAPAPEKQLPSLGCNIKWKATGN